MPDKMSDEQAWIEFWSESMNNERKMFMSMRVEIDRLKAELEKEQEAKEAIRAFGRVKDDQIAELEAQLKDKECICVPPRIKELEAEVDNWKISFFKSEAELKAYKDKHEGPCPICDLYHDEGDCPKKKAPKPSDPREVCPDYCVHKGERLNTGLECFPQECHAVLKAKYGKHPKPDKEA